MSWNLNENLKRSATMYPDRDAIIYNQEKITYAQLNHHVDKLAAGLISRGIRKGDRVALVLGNSLEFVSAYYGILRTGAVVVPINPIFSAREIEYILSNCEAQAVVALGALEQVIAPMQERLPHVQFVVYTGEVEGPTSFASLLEASHGETTSMPDTTPDDLAVILYTSGTTGNPKGAMLTHQNMASNAEALHPLFQLTKEDRVVAVLPIFHVFCMTVCLNSPIALGAAVIIIPKFSPAHVLEIIREEKATLFAGVPTMYNFLLQYPEGRAQDFESIRLCVSGGSSMPVELLYRFEEKYQTIVLEGYGLSEAAPVTTFNPLGGTRKSGSVGVEIAGVSNKIVDDEGNEVPRGEVGELAVKGPNVMKGYLGMPEATAQVLKNGWLFTGDMAMMDDEGYVYIVDRKKDLILVGGYNVYPREVEEVLYQHPSVIEVAVIGVPDQEYGEAVKAFVARKSEETTSEELIQFCEEKMAKYKVPRMIEFVSDLPKNTTGKILRKALREHLTAEAKENV
ncbi:long-chain-fatty-acid--CoA ligase [Brevibacillus ginsengisoli]|uniref:long-chain-fatty-acid--CoA ligase n=1 Tax=Brevibacillus ginsengisoli TaxID=363854 RepID=UPI003CE91F21